MSKSESFDELKKGLLDRGLLIEHDGEEFVNADAIAEFIKMQITGGNARDNIAHKLLNEVAGFAHALEDLTDIVTKHVKPTDADADTVAKIMIQMRRSLKRCENLHIKLHADEMGQINDEYREQHNQETGGNLPEYGGRDGSFNVSAIEGAASALLNVGLPQKAVDLIKESLAHPTEKIIALDNHYVYLVDFNDHDHTFDKVEIDPTTSERLLSLLMAGKVAEGVGTRFMGVELKHKHNSDNPFLRFKVADQGDDSGTPSH